MKGILIFTILCMIFLPLNNKAQAPVETLSQVEGALIDKEYIAFVIHDPPSCRGCFGTLDNFFNRSGFYEKYDVFVISHTPEGNQVIRAKKDLMSDHIEVLFVSNYKVWLEWLKGQEVAIPDFNSSKTPYIVLYDAKKPENSKLFPYKTVFHEMNSLKNGFIDYFLDEVLNF